MRKKYLSALLFGALLFASAGTFTSCKDYDDDINNLQEQINTVVSDLASLKTTVEGLGGYVTDVKVEDGKLVVTANGSTVSYDLPAGTSSEVTNIEIKGGHLYVNNEDKGSVGNTVTVNEDGELLIDGNASGLKVGSEVIIKDSSNGMYTISIDGQTIQLPMASATINSVELVNTPLNGDYSLFTQAGTSVNEANGGIHWAPASKNIEWKGALGNITKGDLLVGGISTLDVKVSPATFDLGASELTLVDSEGKVAEVTVNAEASTDGVLVGSRAASKNGQWTLSVKPTDKATSDNMATLYTNGKNKNVRYALAVDGRVVSDYCFVVDTWTAATAYATNYNADNLLYKGKTLTEWGKLPIGDCEFTYKEINCADSYFEFEGTMVEKAKKYGVVANGMTITITDAFAKSQEDLTVTLKQLGLDGQVVSSNVTFAGQNTTVDGAVEAEKTTYKVAYNAAGSALNDIVVDFGTLITANMTNDEIEDVASVSYEIADDKANKFIVSDVSNAQLYVGDKQYTNSNSFAQVTSLELPIASVQSTAEAGSYTLVMTAKDSKGNEIKKFNLPIDITLPAFDEVFTKSTKWEDDALTLTLSTKTEDKVQLNFNKTFESKVAGAKTANIAYEVTTKVNNKAVADNKSENEVVTFNDNILNADKQTLSTNKLDVTASYSFGAEGLTISTDFTTGIKSIFQDVALVYYKDNVAQTVAKVGTDDIIAGLTGDGTANNKYNGLALKLGEYVVPISSTEVIDGMVLKASTNNTVMNAGNVVIFDVNTIITGLETATGIINASKVIISTMKVGEKATMTIKFTDYSGIVTEKSIAIEKPAN